MDRTALTLVAGLLPSLAGAALGQVPTFEHVVIDASNPDDPHCKTLGDISGDGLPDAIVASSSGDGLFWYEYPGWQKYPIRSSGSWTTDMQAADVDGDLDLDVVVPDGGGIKWYENPLPGGDPRTAPWSEHLIGAAGANHHDVEVGDIEGDGDLDVVTRDKSGGETLLWRQENPTTWTEIAVASNNGEGTALGDLDGDLDLDVAQNGYWVEQVTSDVWVEHPIDSGWVDVGVLIVDVDGDGTNDVVLAPSESSGKFSWYQAVDPVNGPWTETVIDGSVSYFHTFEAADMDRDGDLDLVTAEMHQSADPDEVSLYLNDGGGLAWTQVVVATSGSHNLRIGDVGGDGDTDIFGANWSEGAPNSAVVEMWENQSEPLPLDLWERHVVETDLPWQAVFVDGRDLDGDGLPDLVTGGWWYPNPGALGGGWVRTALGAPLHNMAAVHDFDGDGDLDVLGTDGQVGGDDFVWAQNDGTGQFGILDIDEGAIGGDFLQGVSVAQLVPGEGTKVLLSWHNGALGTSMFSVPPDPTSPDWALETISATTNEEQIPVGDVDGDGDLDVHLGTEWLRQEPGGVFSVQSGVTLASGVPDRVVLGDLDADGDLDVVIGVEFGQLLVWGENEGGGAGWTEHVIATDFDYFSVDVGDVDADGDLDVVGGAHQGNGEVFLYENDGTGSAWTTHVVDPGDSTEIDHHDGTRLVDMDLDGDLDVVSVGWTKKSLTVYENLAIVGGDITAPTIDSVTSVGHPQRVAVVFSEELEPTSAEASVNYEVTQGVAVKRARLGADGRSVTLGTSPLAEGVVYTLRVNDVADLAGNPIMPNTETVFVHVGEDPTGGSVAHWPMDEGAGTVTVDASGNGHHGTLVNGTRWVAGPALDFDGVDDHVDAGAFDVAGTALTLAARIRPRELANCGSVDCRILSKATGTAENDHYFMLSTIESGGAVRLRFRLKTDGVTSTLIASSGDLVDNVWYHVAAVYDGAEMLLYLDGQVVGSAAKTGELTTNAAVDVWIGGNPPGATDRPWEGAIDDVRIYDRALTAEEIAALP